MPTITAARVNMSWSTLNSKNPGCVQIWQGFQARDSVGSTTGAKWYNLIDPDATGRTLFSALVPEAQQHRCAGRGEQQSGQLRG